MQAACSSAASADHSPASSVACAPTQAEECSRQDASLVDAGLLPQACRSVDLNSVAPVMIKAQSLRQSEECVDAGLVPCSTKSQKRKQQVCTTVSCLLWAAPDCI